MKIKFAFKPDERNINDIIFSKEAIEYAAKDYLKIKDQYGIIGQPVDKPDEKDEQAFFIMGITYDSDNSVFEGDIGFYPNEYGEKLKDMLIEDAENYRIVTLSNINHGDWLEHKDSITVIVMKILHVGIVTKDQVC